MERFAARLFIFFFLGILVFNLMLVILLFSPVTKEIQKLFAEHNPGFAYVHADQVPASLVLAFEQIRTIEQMKQATIKAIPVEGWQTLLARKKIEKLDNPETILELYFNTLHFGQGLQGVAAASAYYFRRPITQLGFTEVAYLVSLASEE